MTKIAVLGLGKIGHPLATVLQRHGFQVYGVEVNQERCEQLGTKQNTESSTDLEIICRTVISCLRQYRHNHWKLASLTARLW